MDVFDRHERLRGFLSTIAKLSMLRLRLGQNKKHLDVVPRFEKIIKKANERVRAWGGNLYVVYIPSITRNTPIDKDSQSLPYRNDVLSALSKLGIPVFDLHETFKNQPDPLSLIPFRLKGHFTPEGNKLVADTINSRLNQLGHFPECANGCLDESILLRRRSVPEKRQKTLKK